jgi:hypothetical protein
MAANVVKGLKHSAAIPCDNNAFAADFAQKIVACFAKLLRASGTNPFLKEKAFQLLLKYSRVRVVAGWQSHRLRGHKRSRG